MNTLESQAPGKQFKTSTLYKEGYLRKHKNNKISTILERKKEEGEGVCKNNPSRELHFWQNYYKAILNQEEEERNVNYHWILPNSERDSTRRAVQQELMKRRKQEGFQCESKTGEKKDFQFLREANGPIKDPTGIEDRKTANKTDGWNTVKGNKAEATGWGKILRHCLERH